MPKKHVEMPDIEDDLIVDVEISPIVPKKRPTGRPKKLKTPIPPVVMEEESDDDEEPVPVPVVPSVTLSPVVSLSALGKVKKLFNFAGTKLTPLQQAYIMAFAVRGTRAEACTIAEVTYAQVEKWMEDAEFAHNLQHAINIVGDRLESELFRRAMDGSDRLLIRAMEANKPEKYARIIKGDINIMHSWADLARQAVTEDDTTSTTYEEVIGDGDVGGGDG